MKTGWLKRVLPFGLGIVSASAAMITALWLFGVYIQAWRAAPAEKALIESLKEEARSDAEIQKVLQPEMDRQRNEAIARRWKYNRGSILLLLSAATFLIWWRWLRDSVPAPRAPTPGLAHGGTAVQAPVGDLEAAAPPPIPPEAVDAILRAEGRSAESAIPILQSIQSRFRFLPEEALRRVIETTEITPSQIAGVATFYGQFRQKPVGEHVIRVCEGTACHVAGAVEVENELRRRLGIPEGQDTDRGRQYTIERVACLGSCSLAPVITIDDHIYGHVSALSAGKVLEGFRQECLAQPADRNGKRQKAPPTVKAPVPQPESTSVEIRIGLGSCGIASGAEAVHAELQTAVGTLGHTATVKSVGCSGLCHSEPLVEVVEGNRHTLYGNVDPQTVQRIVRTHVRPRGLVRQVREQVRGVRDKLFDDAAWVPPEQKRVDALPYLGKQVRVVLENCGEINPLSLREYRSRGGMRALEECLTRLTPEEVIERVRASGLRGRGGAGFPTGRKWELTRRAAGARKYVICNGDEGDPGAFMDRAVLEADPFRVIEGLSIAAFAVGAHEGYFYVRREYPIAVRHVREAIRLMEEAGMLGDGILGTEYGLRLQVREGAGAFVCGEETALIQSLEGQRGMPRLRPPFPAESGLHNAPTLINNVETLACLPWIFRNGPGSFAAMGVGRSRGTKVFSLAGKVNRGGLIEVPMGITIREIVEDIGGGVKGGRPFKAVLIGGPSGGCIPAELAGTRIDYEELASTGAIMGSGGLVVLDDRDCAVEIARYFLQFTQSESCGKCTFCRIGTRRMLEILERICSGHGRESDIRALEELGTNVRRGSLCGLGQTAPNPVLTTLLYFRDEYEAHVREKRCPAAQCKALINYRILETCTGCTLCAQACPVGAITARPYEIHEVDDALCTRCGMCLTACPENSVEVA